MTVGVAPAELRRPEQRAGPRVASAGREEVAAGQTAASAGVHHVVSPQRGQHGERSLKRLTS